MGVYTIIELSGVELSLGIFFVQSHRCSFLHVVPTTLENLEMSGNLIIVRKFMENSCFIIFNWNYQHFKNVGILFGDTKV